MKSSKLAVGALLFSLCFGAACTEDKVQTTCRNIPAGGCPINQGACSDPTCSAVYACRPDGVWTLRQTCPLHDLDGATPPARDASGRDGGYNDVPGSRGGPGCADLQPPDCALAVAGACPNGCCGCEDLFVCVNRGWSPWGSCGDAGITPR